MTSLVTEIRKKWKPRKKTAHKGDFGRIFILAGSRGFAGAAHLAAMGALRSGAGLVTLGVPDKVYTVLAKRETEVMVKPFPSNTKGSFSYKALPKILKFLSSQDVLALGPGLSQEKETQKLIRALLKRIQIPTVIDADGLNALVGQTKILQYLKRKSILTPHPGEFKRLFGGNIRTQSERKKEAAAIAKKFQAVLVLKGHETVISSSKGSVWLNRTGNPGMATGGTGDVLTGMIAALTGQGFNLLEAARYAVYIHGVAGDQAARKTGEVSLIASDLLEFIPKVIKKIRKQ